MNSVPAQPSNQSKRTSKLAVISLEMGIISLTTPFWAGQFGELIQALTVFSIGTIAVALGTISLYRIGKYHHIKGRWMGILGLVGGGPFALFYFGMLIAFVVLGP